MPHVGMAPMHSGTRSQHSGGLCAARVQRWRLPAWGLPREGLGIGTGFKDKYKFLSIQDKEGRTFQLGTRARVESRTQKKWTEKRGDHCGDWGSLCGQSQGWENGM